MSTWPQNHEIPSKCCGIWVAPHPKSFGVTPKEALGIGFSLPAASGDRAKTPGLDVHFASKTTALCLFGDFCTVTSDVVMNGTRVFVWW